jgi:hypothetical protein
MAWLNTGMRRQDIVSGIVKNQWVIVQPSGARFSNNHSDQQVYLNGAVVEPLLAVYYDIQNEAGNPSAPLNGRLGEYVSVAYAAAAPTAGAGDLSTITEAPRGQKHVYANSVGKSIAEWDARTGKVVCQGVRLTDRTDVAQAKLDIEQALQLAPAPPESASGTRITAGSGEIVDGTTPHAVWTIAADGKLLRNNAWTSGVTAVQALYLSSVVYRQSGARWYSWDGSVWIDEGIADPENPTPSIDFFTVPDDGAYLIGDDGVTYERGAQAGAGFILLENGVDRGGWCLQIKIGNVQAAGAPTGRTVHHSNPLGLGYIYRLATGAWSGFVADPEGGPVTPVAGTTTGSMALNGNVLTVADATGFDIGDSVFVEPLSGAGVGPGGAWPPTRYANATARNNALGSHAEIDHVGQTDTGEVWVKLGGVWERARDSFGSGGRFYQSNIRAIGLVATITNKVGTTLTLNRTCAINISGAVVHWNGANILHNALNNAADGTPGSRTVVNANTIPEFVGRASVCIVGVITPQNKNYIHFTCNTRGSMQFYSPKGAPCLSFQWISCTGCIDELVEKRGNFTIANYGLGWAGSTVPGTGGYLTSQPNVSSLYPAGTDWRLCTDCEQRDQTVTDVPIRASGAQYSGNCWSRRVKNVQTDVMADYTQYQHQWDNCDGGGMEDPEVDAYAYITGFEVFHCRGSVITRPRGRNAFISINDSGGWICFRDPANPGAGTGELRFTAGCMIPCEAYPSYMGAIIGTPNIGTAAVWINRNAGTANVAAGGTLTDAVIIQEGYLDSANRNMASIKVANQLPGIRLNGAQISGPNTRMAGIGVVGIQTENDMQTIRIGRVVVTGEAVNSGNDWNFYVTNAIDEGGNLCNAGGRNWNGTIS